MSAGAPGAAAALHIEGLCKRFGTQPVLDGFGLTLQRGEILGLLGPNGCGKSTVLHCVAGLLRPEAGQIHVLGQSLGSASRQHLALCAQTPALYPDLLPAENLVFFARLYGLSAAQARARAADTMQRFGLLPHAATRAGALSGGWRQRLHLAVAVVHQPALLLLDEPTAAVDTEARRELADLIRGLRDSGTAVLLTTHHLPEAQTLCDRVALMQGGRVAAIGTVADLLARVPAQAVAEVQGPDPAALHQRADALGWVSLNAGSTPRWGLPSAMDLRELLQALDGVPVTAASVRPVELEDAYNALLSPPSQASRRRTGFAGLQADGPCPFDEQG